MEEVWKDIPNYEKYYQVSNLGRIKSIRNNKILSLRKDYRGYLDILLSVNGIKKRYKVHRLVGMAFIPNPDNLPQINHKDENKENNNVLNLEWCTNKYNMNYGTAPKRRLESFKKTLKSQTNKRNNNLWQPKKIIQYNIESNEIKRWNSIKQASKELKIIPQNISECCRGKRKTAGGYIWKFL